MHARSHSKDCHDITCGKTPVMLVIPVASLTITVPFSVKLNRHVLGVQQSGCNRWLRSSYRLYFKLRASTGTELSFRCIRLRFHFDEPTLWTFPSPVTSMGSQIEYVLSFCSASSTSSRLRHLSKVRDRQCNIRTTETTEYGCIDCVCHSQ